MKDIIKKWWFWLIIALIIIILVLVYFLFQKNNNGVGTAGISKKEFERIKTGMSNFEVNGIIDEFDEWNNDEVYEKCCEEISKEHKDQKYTYQYKYYGEKTGYAIITYQADYSKSFLEIPEVIKKENFGLK